MGILKRFNEILGLVDDVEDEKKRFVQRINQAIFYSIDSVHEYDFNYEVLFDVVCFELGVNAQTLQRREPYSPASRPPALKTLTNNDFTKTLEVLCFLYANIYYQGDLNRGKKWLSQQIDTVLSRCTCDIGIRWKDGFFYPSGAEELDKYLIEDTWTWLKDYSDEEKDFRRALHCYLEEKHLNDVIKNCYSAIEGVVRKVLSNNKTLDNNKDELLSKINLSDGWKSILANYITYAHDYRHASDKRHKITKQEAEAYLYMTGLITRLTIESQ